MVSVFILHSSHDFYISACLDESLIDNHLLHTVINNQNFKPKTLHKIKLDVLFSSNIIIRNKFSKIQYPPVTSNQTNTNSNSYHVGMDISNTNTSSPNHYQNPSFQQHSNTQQHHQQHQRNISNSSDEENEEVIHLNYKKQNILAQNNMQANISIPSTFSKSNIKIHNTNSLIYNNNNPIHTDNQSMQTRSNNYNNMYASNKYYQNDGNSNETFYSQQHQASNYSKANANRNSLPVYNQVYPSNQFDSNYSNHFYLNSQQLPNQSSKKFNNINTYLNSLQNERAKNLDTNAEEMQRVNNGGGGGGSEKNISKIRNSYEFDSLKRKSSNEASQQHFQQDNPTMSSNLNENISEINSSISSMSSNNYNLENRVLESYLNTIKKVGESSATGTPVLYKNYSRSDECDNSEYSEKFVETASSYNKSV